MYELELPVRSPFDWAGLLSFFEARAIPGVETVDARRYERRVTLGGRVGTIAVQRKHSPDRLIATVALPVSTRTEVRRRLTSMLDLDVDIDSVGKVLRRSPVSAPPLRRHPGIRVPGVWDPFEVVVRAIVGQQVSVKGARTILGRIVERTSEPGKLLFPEPDRLAVTEVRGLGMPHRRADTLRAVARAIADGTIDLRGGPEARRRLLELPGIGPWTVEYIAMRAFRDPDAFPHGDLVLRRVAGGDSALSAPDLLSLAEAWRPWRAYATILLWAESSIRPPDQHKEQ